MIYPESCDHCSSHDIRYQYDRHEPVRVAIGTGQAVEMPAAGQEGVLQVNCLSCGNVTVHHVGWFDPPAGDDRWTVRTVSAGAVGSQIPTGTGDSPPDDAQNDSPRYNDRDPS